MVVGDDAVICFVVSVIGFDVSGFLCIVESIFDVEIYYRILNFIEKDLPIFNRIVAVVPATFKQLRFRTQGKDSPVLESGTGIENPVIDCSFK